MQHKQLKMVPSGGLEDISDPSCNEWGGVMLVSGAADKPDQDQHQCHQKTPPVSPESS